MSGTPARDFTRLLADIGAGHGDRAELTEQLYRQVYAELHAIAAGAMRHERAQHTLQSTALVHEAYLKLVDQTISGWQSRAHFFGVAARAMRQILVDHARRHAADKRGGGRQRVTLPDDLAVAENMSLDLLALDTALNRLAEQDERMSQVVEMRVFGGLLSREVAEALGVSKRTVDEDWKVAKLFLARELTAYGSI
ncbi:MAG: sigma-70 family RNA polymerase sigma factor [bacterium]|nr:sigma-70 family RNA polymerase sigma factor [bacterium]